jgi:hypothetical protein
VKIIIFVSGKMVLKEKRKSKKKSIAVKISLSPIPPCLGKL